MRVAILLAAGTSRRFGAPNKLFARIGRETLLARTIRGITGAGQPAFVTVSNDAEGCAPCSITLLSQAIAAL